MARENKKKKKNAKEQWLPNNKAFFLIKKAIPKNKYLNDIRIGELDISFLIIILVLLVCGLLMMYSASYAWAINENLSADYYFKRQLMMAGIGMAGLIVLSSKLFDYHFLKNHFITYGYFALCVVGMLIIHIPGVGVSDGGASRWIDLGFFTIQPSEFMKLAIIMLFAHMIANNHSKMNTFTYGIMPYCIVLFAVAILMLIQPHLSGTIIICAIAAFMMLIGGSNLKHLGLLVILGVGAVILVAFMMYKMGYDYIYNRIQSWLYTFADENKDVAWQTRNSLIAIGSGGLFGLGLGNSRQKFLYLPESKNDFVFSIFCEEFGFVGAVVVITMFIALIYVGFKIAANAPDKYGMMLCSGIIVQIGLQAMLNIAVVSNVAPNTGISLPFFSYGGSALVLQLIEMGIVLNISRQSIPSKGRADSDDILSDREKAQINKAKKALGADPKYRNNK